MTHSDEGGIAELAQARDDLQDRMARLGAVATTLEDILRQTLSALAALREELSWLLDQQTGAEMQPQLAVLVAQIEFATALSDLVVARCRQDMADTAHILAATEHLMLELKSTASDQRVMRPAVRHTFYVVRASICRGEALVRQTAETAENFLDRSQEIDVIRTKIRQHYYA